MTTVEAQRGTGTVSRRPRLAVVVLVVLVAAAIGATGCQAGAQVPATDGDVQFSAVCDTTGHAVDVQPDTAAARRAADRMCAAITSEVNTAPWPDGLHPLPGGAVAHR